MRSSRIEKTKKRKRYINSMLTIFLAIIPTVAVLSAFALQLAYKEPVSSEIPVVSSLNEKGIQAFKYNFDISHKQLYRVELERYDQYEDAEGKIAELKKKKLNGFIIKEHGYVAAYGLFWNESQGDAAVSFLKRKNIESTVVPIIINAVSIPYQETDKTLIELASAVDTAILKILSEKSALSLEILYSDKAANPESLKAIHEVESKLIKYLNYLKDIKISEESVNYKQNLEALINEVLVDKLQADNAYDYYRLQNSLMNQGNALVKFYEKLSI